jgi:hypothetical protein
LDPVAEAPEMLEAAAANAAEIARPIITLAWPAARRREGPRRLGWLSPVSGRQESAPDDHLALIAVRQPSTVLITNQHGHTVQGLAGRHDTVRKRLAFADFMERDWSSLGCRVRHKEPRGRRKQAPIRSHVLDRHTLATNPDQTDVGKSARGFERPCQAAEER